MALFILRVEPNLCTIVYCNCKDHQLKYYIKAFYRCKQFKIDNDSMLLDQWVYVAISKSVTCVVK